MDVEVQEMASSAVLSATCILRTVTSDSEIQSYLNGLPTYFHVMIAFAVVFLFKVSTRFSKFAEVDTYEVQRLLGRLMAVLQDVSRTMHPRHLMVTITECTRDALQRSYSKPVSVAGSGLDTVGQIPHNTRLSSNDIFADGTVDQFFNEYDFLVDHIQEPSP